MPSAGLCVRFLLYLTLIIYCPEHFIIIFIKKSFPSNRIPILVFDNRMFDRVLVAIPNYITIIRTFCILKKMAISAFHYLTLSVRCEELDAHINYLYLFLKSTYCEYILEKILSTSEAEPILALIAPSPL